MKFDVFRISIFLFLLVIFNACKDDENSDYIPLNITANADIGEVFQNSSVTIAMLNNDSNIPKDGEISLTAPQSGLVIINNNGTPATILDDTLQYTPDETFEGEVSFEYTVCDPTGQSCATATVTIQVLPFSPVNFDISTVPFDKLSDYNFFEGNLAELSPVYGVLPYEPINALFSDYAHKKRFVWMPYNVQATYVSDGDVLDFPTGSALIKTFYYENVLPDNTTKNIETRVLIKKDDGWIFANYIWDEAQEEAFLNTTGYGFNVPVEWVENGETKWVNYRIPSDLECFICHKFNDIIFPIGPKPQNLNAIYEYADGIENQLEKWKEIGYLSNTNLPTTIETVPSWKDISQSLETRVRSYFDMNCAHCHIVGGHCGARSLRLAFRESHDHDNLGVCTDPDLQVPGYDGAKLITPGDASNSILYFRVATTLEEYAMPMIGRSLADEAFLPVLEEWINSLTEPCD
ncbi:MULTISPECIES: Ig-like domain-containing protein [Aequorivita]|uniref:Cadherin-like domain-containing protein n=2 Tax=Aequorivita TaxID=153265 RepID=A0AB35Z0Z3_9FLAO|nr:cadherin-like domain-containing protein [Aequorivita sp. Ant34-E75]WGF91385.1 Ig-like domain-containing protein [Aequorivita sp. Ant34-E75]